MSGSVCAGGVLCAALLATACAAGTPDGDGAEGAEGARAIEHLMELHARADYFGIAAALDTMAAATDPRHLLLRASSAHAFNDPATSNAVLTELGDGLLALPEPLQVIAYRLRFRNHLRLHDYGAAAEVAAALLALPALDSVTRAEVANEALIARALADAMPQRVLERGASEIRLREDGRLPVRVGDSLRHYVFDTGANLSVLTRSEAEAVGARIRETGVEVGTVTGARVAADVAIVPRLALGAIELADVAFLVLPDASLTFGELHIPGIIGFPVIEALGEVEFRPGGILRVPAEVPVRPVRNLAMEFLMPLVRAEVLGEEVVCDLDTGAGESSLHLPFYDRMRDRIDALAGVDTVRFAGAAGERRMPARILEDATVVLGGEAVSLARLPVYLESVAAGSGSARDCRLGLDVLRGLGGYLMNFRSMSLLPLRATSP